MALVTDAKPAHGLGRRLFLAGLLVVLAVWIDFSPFHRAQNADSLIPVLASLDEWTFYFWAQDRFGMPVSLLAVPFRDPTVNLLVQSAVTIFCGLSVFFLLASYLAGPRSTLGAGALGAALFIGMQPEHVAFEYLATHPYGVSLSAGLAGVLLLDSGLCSEAVRILAGATLLLVAMWVNPGSFIVLVPMVIGRRLLAVGPVAGQWTIGKVHTATDGVARGGTSKDPSALDRPHGERGGRRESEGTAQAPSGPKSRFWGSKPMQSRMLQSLLLLCLAFVASLTASALYPALFRTPRGIMSVADWPSIWATAAAKVAAWTSKTWLASLAILTALALITVLTLRKADATRRGLVAAGIVLGAGVAVFCFMGTLAHASKGGLPERYGILPMILLQEGLLLLLALSLSDRMGAPARRMVDIAGVGLLIASVALTYGPPSPSRMQQGLDQALGQRTEEVIREGCTHVVGDYWTVWPTVFHTNATLYRLGSKHRVWGITIRSEITQDLWLPPAMQETARFAVGVGAKDAEAASFFRAHYKLQPLVLTKTLKTISVFAPPKPAKPGGD